MKKKKMMILLLLIFVFLLVFLVNKYSIQYMRIVLERLIYTLFYNI
ncbi:hypothetical protein C824_003469 [Schaedlerella arabinosiphila]|jgi:hypothetical protein|nr:hypothetical protein C824_003469 [Schaedlerella arabinosiphila]